MSHEIIKNLSADEALEKLKSGNQIYMNSRTGSGDISPEKRLDTCRNGQQPYAIIITCSDSRVIPECGVSNMLKRLEDFEIKAGRTPEEVKSHSARYNREFFPITITEHLDLLRQTGFSVAELFWHSYMQSGFYAVKKV